MDKHEQGRYAESIARAYLESQQYRFIEANFNRRVGEIDLIMLTPDSLFSERTIVFVEVRYRSRLEYGGAIASIDWKKQRKLIRASRAWLQKNAGSKDLARIDVIALTQSVNVEVNTSCKWQGHDLTWIQNAVEEAT